MAGSESKDPVIKELAKVESKLVPASAGVSRVTAS